MNDTQINALKQTSIQALGEMFPNATLEMLEAGAEVLAADLEKEFDFSNNVDQEEFDLSVTRRLQSIFMRPAQPYSFKAKEGDRIRVRGSRLDRIGEIVAVQGIDGAPPYLVRFDNDRLSLIYPGSGATVEPAR
ncbi:MULTISPECIES: DUF1918 domain-containing protein [unclassified Streptomyces]|uniref:DUF1918 domain-containing protein n=1 Tax=unclassified Streptomyces TaxID=2593676 RepID=UPI003D74E396